MRFRYSLRALLIVVAIAPVIVYWFMLPTLHARRFVQAVNAGDFATAEKLALKPKDRFPGDWTKHQHFEPRAGLQPWTWNDVASGKREIYVGISYGDGSGIASCGQECTAHRRGIELGMSAP